MTPQQRAEAAKDLMYAEDSAARHLDIRVLSVAPGFARLQMPVRAEMTNGHGMCHGGYIFTLADTAFAYACNSHNQRAVAAGAQIEFLVPAYRSDLLEAEAQEQHRAGRSGVYDVRVTREVNGKPELVALFRGKSATIKGQFIEESST